MRQEGRAGQAEPALRCLFLGMSQAITGHSERKEILFPFLKLFTKRIIHDIFT